MKQIRSINLINLYFLREITKKDKGACITMMCMKTSKVQAIKCEVDNSLYIITPEGKLVFYKNCEDSEDHRTKVPLVRFCHWRLWVFKRKLIEMISFKNFKWNHSIFSSPKTRWIFWKLLTAFTSCIHIIFFEVSYLREYREQLWILLKN